MRFRTIGERINWIRNNDNVLAIANRLPLRRFLGFFYAYDVHMKPDWDKEHKMVYPAEVAMTRRIYDAAGWNDVEISYERKDVARAFAIAAKKAGIPMLERTWMRVRLGAQRTI